jgi:hypothetical protein
VKGVVVVIGLVVLGVVVVKMVCSSGSILANLCWDCYKICK